MTQTVNVAVNLLWLAPGRVGGSEQYLTRQLAGLPVESALSVELFVQQRFTAAHRELAERFASTPMPVGRDWRPLRIAAEHTWLPYRARHVDVVHHGGGTVPFTGRHPVLLTVHDLQYRQFPHYFSPVRLAYLRHMMPRSAHRASMIATPSEYVRGTVIDAFGIDPDRVVVVPHGVPLHTQPSVDEQLAAARRLGVDGGKFLVYPAITHPHKGHTVLVDMLTHLDDDIALVLIGGEGTAEDELRDAVRRSRVDARVVRAGRVSDGDRDALIAGASALVFPSEYEGFGAPLVEAMMLGTPVVCSGHPAIREVVADAGVVVTERVGEAWAEGVEAALARTDVFAASGRTRAGAFSIERSGEALADTYRAVASIDVPANTTG